MAWTREQKADYRRKVWELRLAGRNGTQIAQHLGISPSVVSRMLARAREEASVAIAKNAQEERVESVSRLDRMLTAVWDKVRQGNERSIDTALRIEERRAKLQGLDATAKSALDLTSGGEPIKFTVTIPRVMRVDDAPSEPE